MFVNLYVGLLLREIKLPQINNMIVFILEHKDNNHLGFGNFNSNFNLGNKSLANSIGDCLVCD